MVKIKAVKLTSKQTFGGRTGDVLSTRDGFELELRGPLVYAARNGDYAFIPLAGGCKMIVFDGDPRDQYKGFSPGNVK